MPHDLNGDTLKPGDVVMVPCVVESVNASFEFCNVQVRTVYPMPPYETGTVMTLNTKQCYKTQSIVIPNKKEEK